MVRCRASQPHSPAHVTCTRTFHYVKQQVNKVDLVAQDQIKELSVCLSRINTEARIVFCQRAAVDMQDVMGIKAFDPARATAKLGSRCLPVQSFGTEDKLGEGWAKSSGGHRGISTVSIVVDCEMELTALNCWLVSLLKERGTDLFRMKGIVAIQGKDEMFIFHGVHMIFDGKQGPKWAEHEKRHSRMVFIGKALHGEALRKGFAACCVKNAASTLHGAE